MNIFENLQFLMLILDMVFYVNLLLLIARKFMLYHFIIIINSANYYLFFINNLFINILRRL